MATLALNWQEDSAVRIKKVIHQPLTRIIRLIFIIFLTVHDLALAMYFYFVLKEESQTGKESTIIRVATKVIFLSFMAQFLYKNGK